MTNQEAFIERVMRYLDGNLSPESLATFEKEICEDVEKRWIYRDICQWAQNVHEAGVSQGETRRALAPHIPWLVFGALLLTIVIGFFVMSSISPKAETNNLAELDVPEEMHLEPLVEETGLVDEEHEEELSLSRSFLIEVGHRFKNQEWPKVRLMDEILVANAGLHSGHFPMTPEELNR